MNEYTTFYRCTRVYSLSILGWEEYISLFKFFKKNSSKLLNTEGRVM